MEKVGIGLHHAVGSKYADDDDCDDQDEDDDDEQTGKKKAILVLSHFLASNSCIFLARITYISSMF